MHLNESTQKIKRQIADLHAKCHSSMGTDPAFSRQALELARSINDNNLIAESHVNLGICYSKRGRKQEAIEQLTQAKMLYEQIPSEEQNLEIVSQLYDTFGHIYDDLADLKTALAYQFKTLSIANQPSFAHLKQKVLSDIGYIYYRLGVGVLAIEYLSKAANQPIRNLEPDSYLFTKIDAFEKLAAVFELYQAWDKALHYRLLALELLEGTFFNKLHATVLLNLANTYLAVDNLSQVQAKLDQFYHFLDQQFHLKEDPSTQFHLNYVLGKRCLYEKDFDQALHHCQLAIDFAKKQGDIQKVYEGRFLQGFAALKQKKFDDCLAVFSALHKNRLAFPTKHVLQLAMLELYQALGKWEEAYKLLQVSQHVPYDNTIEEHLFHKFQEESEKSELVSLSNQILSQKNLELERLHQEKDEFLRIVAHDLRNPISAMRIAAESLKLFRANLSEQKVNHRLQNIMDLSDKMNNIITQLQSAELAESKRFSSHSAPYSVNEMIRQSVQQQMDLATVKQQMIHVNFNAHNIIAYRNQLEFEQIIDNLLSNAIKFSPRASEIRIIVDLVEPKKVRVQVQDEGQGLTEGDKKRLFKKYTKLSATPTGNETSTGLGLYIAKKYIEAVGGTLTAVSAGRNKGSTFILIFPISQ